jgi:hypothetical protein
MRRSIYLNSILILALSAFTGWSTIHAQYKLSSNNRLIVSEEIADETAIAPVTAAHDFFRLAGEGDRENWEKLLSKNCFRGNTPTKATDEWYETLSKSDKNYPILKEANASRNNQKIYYISSGDRNTKEGAKQMILVKEKGEWKILYAQL